MQEMQIEHRTSSPYYPQSNRLAESMVKVSNDLIEKAILQKKPWFYYIEEQQSAPISGTIPSPADILFGRMIRSNVTILLSQLMNNQIVYIREEIAKKEGKIICQEENSLTTELELEPGQAIWHQDPQTKKWNSGVIIESLKKPYSFIIESDNGVTYRRNRNFLKPHQVSTSASSEQTDHSTGAPRLPAEYPTLPKVSTSGLVTLQSASSGPPEMHSPAEQLNG